MGNNATIDNFGVIRAEGNKGRGIFAEGIGNKITNRTGGQISTFGTQDNSHGILGVGDGVTVINEAGATIATLGRVSKGIQVQGGEGAKVINYGLITAKGYNSGGIRAIGDRAYAANYGTISLTELSIDDYGNGITIDRPTSWAYNFGTITVAGGDGLGSFGMNIGRTEAWEGCDPLDLPDSGCNPDDLGAAVNYGLIDTYGEQNVGMLADDYGVSLINHGQIITRKERSHGMRSQGAGLLTVENSGFIKVNDFDGSDKSFAIMMTPNGNGYVDGTTFHLKLNRGSVLVGDVALRRPDHSIVEFGSGLSAVVRVDEEWFFRRSGVESPEDFEEVVTLNSASGIHFTRDYILYAADTTDYVAQEAVMGELTRAVQSAISARLRNPQTQPELEAQQGRSFGQFCQGLWFTSFGGYAKSDGGDAYAGYRGWTSGTAMGCELDGGYGAHFGLSYASVEPDGDIDYFAVENFGGFVGLEGDVPGAPVRYSLTVGYAHQKHERYLSDNRIQLIGLDKADDNYASAYVTPTLAMQLPDVGLGRFDLQLSYTAIWYSEHDFEFAQSDADLSIDESFSNAVSAQLAHSVTMQNGNVFSIGGGVSWQQRMDTGLTFGGESFDMADPRDADEALMGQAFIGMSAPTGLWTRVAATIGQDEQYGVSVGAGMRF
ncbi:MAG: hypothetical protein HRU27_03510 [Rhizobiaceae bacterium]|nr:hypothetical protein [Hyphomicrobiales bacterium]NRB29648.1 hypothetical protein [Rhizobiaceae bacterium]